LIKNAIFAINTFVGTIESVKSILNSFKTWIMLELMLKIIRNSRITGLKTKWNSLKTILSKISWLTLKLQLKYTRVISKIWISIETLEITVMQRVNSK
jgi:hypothetical protein